MAAHIKRCAMAKEPYGSYVQRLLYRIEGEGYRWRSLIEHDASCDQMRGVCGDKSIRSCASEQKRVTGDCDLTTPTIGCECFASRKSCNWGSGEKVSQYITGLVSFLQLEVARSVLQNRRPLG